MKKPNLFIVGAPKCGTTSLAKWLSEHPNIYMAPNKEPHFFSRDIYKPVTWSLGEYEALFSAASEQHTWVGEASTRYLYSSAAVDNILNYDPDAKFIAMVRNPVDMAQSLHQHLVFNGNELIRDFWRAWGVQELRRTGGMIPHNCRDPDSLLYCSICRLGSQVERLFAKVAEKQRMVVVLDDLRSHPERVFKDVLSFLEIDPDTQIEFGVHNPAKKRRSRFLARIVHRIGNVKNTLGIHHAGLGILNRLDNVNSLPRKFDQITKQQRQVVSEYFRDDVLKLESLLERNLRAWLID